MGLLGQDENLEVPENQPQLPVNGVDPSIFNNIKSKAPANPVYVNDFHDSSTGALSPTDYYPGMNIPIGVGNSSGSEIGSHTIYAPTGQLMPLGLMDARELAIKKAALAKQLEQDNFYKEHQAPTTKHVSVQPYLTDQYDTFVNQSIARAKKAYGKNWMTALQQDPDFNKANRNFQDLAKFHDAIVEHSALLDAHDKDPNMVILPETKKAGSDLLSGIAYKGQNPFAEEGQNLGKKYLGAKSMMDLDVAVNTAVSKMIPDIMPQEKLEKQSDGTHRLVSEYEKETFDPAKQEQIARDVSMQTGWDKDTVLAHVKAIQAEQVKRKLHIFDTYHAPVDKKDDDYSNVAPKVGSVINTGQSNNPNKVNQMYIDAAWNAGANDTKKTLSFAQSNQHSNLTTGELSANIGNFEGSVQDVSVIPYNVKTGRVFKPEEIAKGVLDNNPDVKYKTKVIVNTKPKKDSDGNEIGGSNLVYGVNPDAVKGRVSKGFDEQIQKAEQLTKEKNAQQEAKKKQPAGKKEDPLGLF